MSNPTINTVTGLQGVQIPLYLISQSNYIVLQGLVKEGSPQKTDFKVR
ncbi:hypothetical protein [Pseudomonas syringae]|nr:hypothetical protein [Pseudomonas syringae]